MSNSQWHDDQSIGERALREHKKEQEKLRADNVKLREEPPANCECAGCSYAREKGGDV